jgi:hypothetical protein
MRHLTKLELYLSLFGDASKRPGHLTAHLEKCDQCSSALAALYELEFAFAATLPKTVETGECLSTEELAEFLDGESAEKDEIKAHLETCDACFDSAAYYFTESARMRTALGIAEKPGVATDARPAHVPVALPNVVKARGWREMLEGLLVPLPAFATAAILFLALLATPPARQVEVVLESPSFNVYQKQTDAMPYFYFGGEGKKIDSAPANMTVTSQRGRVTFDWTPVKGVRSYYFFLQETVDGAPSKIREIKDAVPPVSLPSEDFKPGASYRWVAAGNMGDNKYFDGRLEFRVRE